MHHSTSRRAPAPAAPTGQVNDNDNIKVTIRATSDGVHISDDVRARMAVSNQQSEELDFCLPLGHSTATFRLPKDGASGHTLIVLSAFSIVSWTLWPTWH